MPRYRINNFEAALETPESEVIEAIRRELPENISNLKLVKKSVDARNKNAIHFIYAAEFDCDTDLSASSPSSLDHTLFSPVIPRMAQPFVKGSPASSPPSLGCETAVKGSPETRANHTRTRSLDLAPLGAMTPRRKSSSPLLPVPLAPIVVGSGPAGMMAALCLAEAGLKPIIIERGACVEERREAVNRFWQTGELSEETNVQFGEGGAGTFSDGKLMTGIKKDEYTAKVLEEFAAAGAPEEILYLAKPHIGTDKLFTMTKNIRQKIISLGGTYLFNTKLTDICPHPDGTITITIQNCRSALSSPSSLGCETAVKGSPAVIRHCEPCRQTHKAKQSTNRTATPLPTATPHQLTTSHLILALGHSARDTFKMLYERGVQMSQKPFAVGVRIEHKQADINLAQYGKKYCNSPYLGAADYKLATHHEDNRSLYTFCMCPGGVVVGATSRKGHVVTNGMSEFARDKENANAALLVNVDERDFGSEHPLAGIEFQEQLEKKAFTLGGNNYHAPVQTVGDLLAGKPTKKLGKVKPSYLPGVTPSDFKKLFPQAIYETLQKGIREMDKKLRGFADKDAVLTAVESRSSSPVRIYRDENFESNIKGIYPIGEGAGYAGGITSAAADGVKTACKILERL